MSINKSTEFTRSLVRLGPCDSVCQGCHSSSLLFNNTMVCVLGMLAMCCYVFSSSSPSLTYWERG